nr:uncharacterized protein LOC111993782 [Quercus suber]
MCFSNREEVREITFSVPLKLSYMADQKSSVVIPTGCILKNEVQKDRCKLSKLKAKKIVKNARTHLLIEKARRKRLSGQSSRSLAVKMSKVLSAWRKHLPGQSSKLSVVHQGKEIIDLEESTGPEGSIDLGESTKADSLPYQAGLEVEQVAKFREQ